MKILTSEQIRQADRYTIENEPVASIDLMERAARGFVEKFKLLVTDKNCKVSIICGVGNNGGDGLAIARMLYHKGRPIRVFSIGDLEKSSQDFKTNLDRLPQSIQYQHLKAVEDFPLIANQEVVIDGLFGSGLSRPIEGIHADLIQHLNSCEADIFSIDIASGLLSDSATTGTAIIRPTFTIAFQVPKLVFFQPSMVQFVGDWHVVNIGLDEEFIQGLTTSFSLTTPPDVRSWLPKRTKFSHKGDAGRMLLVAGSKGKMGAAILASRAAFRAGVGLLSVHTPSCGRDVLQTAVPEAMVTDDQKKDTISYIAVPEKTNIIVIGPGIGTSSEAAKALEDLLKEVNDPVVLDADAINILAQTPSLLDLLPEESILTPHPGEFQRLVGKWKNDFHRLELLMDFCKTHRVNMVLKGAFSAVCDSSGNVYLNPTGNPGMATAGSGDVLTGIVGALVAQGLKPFEALRLGVFLHGLSGNIAQEEVGEISLIASDLIDFLPQAISDLNRFKYP